MHLQPSMLADVIRNLVCSPIYDFVPEILFLLQFLRGNFCLFFFFFFRSFDFDAFKREYSNKETLTEALPYFWKHLDKENYSIWHCRYLYPEELGAVWMTCNLVGGMCARNVL